MRFCSALALCLVLLATKLYAGDLVRPSLQLYGVGDPTHSVTVEQFDLAAPAPAGSTLQVTARRVTSVGLGAPATPATAMRALSKRLYGKRLALAVGDRVLQTPMVKAELGDRFQLSFCSPATTALVAAALNGDQAAQRALPTEDVCT